MFTEQSQEYLNTWLPLINKPEAISEEKVTLKKKRSANRKELAKRYNVGDSFLTEREAQCYFMLLSGMSNKALAFKLKLDIRTTASNILRPRKRFGIKKIPDMLAYLKTTNFLQIYGERNNEFIRSTE